MNRPMSRRTFAISLVAAAGVLSLGSSALADDFPSKPIHLIVPSAPGGSLDTLGRLVARGLQEQSGVTVVVENKPGASGSIGVRHLVQSAPDGYSILISVPDAVTIYPMVNDNVTYRWDKDLTPLVRFGSASAVYAISGQSPAKSVADFVALAKKDSLNYSTQGQATTSHLLMEWFKLATGTQMLHVPYKGAAPAIMAVISGESSIVAQSLASLAPQFESGRLKPLAVAGASRIPALPDVPTMREAGYPELVSETWFGFFAPAGVQPAIAERLRDLLSTAVDSPTFVEQLKRLGLTYSPARGEAFAKDIAADNSAWKRIIDHAKIRADR